MYQTKPRCSASVFLCTEGSTGEAFLTGTLVGGVEAATELISIGALDDAFEAIKKGADGTRIFQNIVRQGVAEGGEEVISEIGGNIADNLINGRNSNYYRYIDELMLGGKSRGEAKNLAQLKFFGTDLVLAFAGGALSGFAMGGGVSAYGHYSTQSKIDNMVATTLGWDESVYKSLPKDSKTYMREQFTTFLNKVSGDVVSEKLKLTDNISMSPEKVAKLTEINGELAKSLKTEIAKAEARLSELNAINKPTQEQKTQIEQLTEQIKSDRIYLEVVNESIDEMKSKAVRQQGQAQDTEHKHSGIVPYSDEQIETLHKYGGLAEGRDISFGDFYDQSISHNEGGIEKPLYFGVISPWLAEQINEATEFDIAGANFKITGNDLRHTNNEHGPESNRAKAGDVPVTREIVELLPQVLSYPDAILKGKEKGGSPNRIVFKKRINGYLVYVQAFGNKRGNRPPLLSGITMYVESSNKKKAPEVLDAESPSFTSETVLGSPSTNSIRSSAEKINATKGQPKQAQDTVLAKGDKVQQGVEPYSQKQIEWLHGHGVMVEGVDIEIGDFYEKAIAENKRGDKNKLYFGQVSPELAKRIKNETGYDTAGYDFIVNEGTMHHLEKRHGVNSTTLRPGEIPINRKLIALIPEVINNPDTISKEANATKGGETIIKFRKKINGYVAYLQVYGKRKGRKNGRLIAKTYYVESSKNNEAGGAVDAETPNRTSENDSTLPSDTIIRMPEEKINATEGKAAGRLMPAEFKIGGAKTNVKGIASVQSGKVTVKLENGDLALADDMVFENKTQGQLYDKAKHFDTNAAKTFTTVYETNIPVNDYYLGFTRIYGAARAGTAFKQAMQINEYTATLPSHIQKASYKAGVQAGAIADDASMKNAMSVRAKAEQQSYDEWFKEHNTGVIAEKQEIGERFLEAEANGDVAEMNQQRKEYKALDQRSEKTIRDKKVQIGKAVGGVVKLGGEKVADKTGIGANASDIGKAAAAEVKFRQDVEDAARSAGIPNSEIGAFGEFYVRSDGQFGDTATAAKAFKLLSKGEFKAFADMLDLSSPENKAVFWSKAYSNAQDYANTIGGVTLEMTKGGKLVDGWDWLDKRFPTWGDKSSTDQKELWKALSARYANNAKGEVTYVHPKGKYGDIWSEVELKILVKRMKKGLVTIKYKEM